MISALLSAVVVFGSMCTFFLVLERVCYDGYLAFIDWYNRGGYKNGTIVLFTLLILFAVSTFLIFMRRMNRLTETISKISNNIHRIAEGDLDDRIYVKEGNELGRLAEDVNIMAAKIKENREKEKQWNKERYNMITNMSHDLKTPIMSISGYIDLIQKGKYQEQEELLNYCQIVSRKTSELNRSINQLFELSRLNSYDIQLHKCQLNIMQFAEQVLITFIPKFQEKGMEYRLEIKKDITICADPLLLKHLFENLITNALKYAKEGKFLDISAFKKEEEINLCFRNYGKKIPKNEIDRIFMKYYREKSNSGTEGSGCGLAIVKQIVELHEGEIVVQSDDKCTEFQIRMKRNERS